MVKPPFVAEANTGAAAQRLRTLYAFDHAPYIGSGKRKAGKGDMTEYDPIRGVLDRARRQMALHKAYLARVRAGLERTASVIIAACRQIEELQEKPTSDTRPGRFRDSEPA
jgi:hypothetical protein